MALYNYKALSSDGKKISGQLDAPSIQGLKELLIRQKLYPISVEESKEEKAGFNWRQLLLEKPITPKEKILFTKQLAVLLKSGIPLLQALELLGEQFEGRLKRIIIHLKDTIKEGGSLAQGLSDYPRVFPKIYVQLVRAGEASGRLDAILERLTSYLERQLELQKRVKSALRGPLINIAVIILVSIFLLVAVVPKLAQTFASQGSRLPLPTLILMNISNFVKAYYIFIGIGLLGLFIAFKYWQSSSSGKKIIDKTKLYIPIIGHFARMNAIVQFCSTLGMLLEGGVNLAESLDIVCSIIDNEVLASTLREARDKIIKEGKIAQYLKQTKIFPPMAVYLIRTGEESGKLDQMLIAVAQNYEEDLRELADTLSAQLGPFMLLFTAVIVGFIVMAIALPLLGMQELALQGM